MATRNIRTGKAGKEISAVYGWDEMKKKLKLITGAMGAAEAQAIVGAAAFHAYTEIKHSAGSVRVPHEVYEDIFMYNKPRPGKRTAAVSALTGVQKRGRDPEHPTAKAYAKWYPSSRTGKSGVKSPKKSKTLMIPGTMSKKDPNERQKIGENLATI